MKEVTERLMGFLEKSPSAFHAVNNMKDRFLAEGFVELKEQDAWTIVPGGKYFVTRNHSSVIAFSIPETDADKFHIMASHSDSPTFKLKENPEISVEDQYVKLNVERYGGMIMSTWLDRPLSVAGRILVDRDGEIEEILVNLDEDLLMIPNLAIHMNREINDGYVYNAQKDMLPLFGTAAAKGQFMKKVAETAGVEESAILGHDLFLYPRVPATIWGAEKTFFSSPRLDDLECACASMEGFLGAERKNCIAVHCVLDNEEVGSSTTQGAASTFLRDTLIRIYTGIGKTYEDYLRMLAKSFMISADNGHALHPNHPDKCDPANRPVLNGGVLIKYSANQKYCTDGVSAAKFKQLCKKANVAYQVFVNRSDMLGGSTLGNISNTKVSISTVDIGLPQLAMHSAYETAGVEDFEGLCEVVKVFFE